MKDLEQALSFGNYQFTLTQQRTLLKQQFNDSCLFPWNGGMFRLSLEFLNSIHLLDQSHWLIDINENPIWIEDIKSFYQNGSEQYSAAISKYGEEYAKLKTQRSVKSLVGL